MSYTGNVVMDSLIRQQGEIARDTYITHSNQPLPSPTGAELFIYPRVIATWYDDLLTWVDTIKTKVATINWANITTLLTEIGTNIISNINTKTNALRTYFDVDGDGKIAVDDIKTVLNIGSTKQGRLKDMLSDITGALKTNLARLFDGFITTWMGS